MTLIGEIPDSMTDNEFRKNLIEVTGAPKELSPLDIDLVDSCSI